jgi:Fe-S-cluster containining protein
MPDFACLSCGACCAAFRVDFHAVDLATEHVEHADGVGVPRELTVPLTATLHRMLGTDAAPPRCVALAGEVGQAVRCTIYQQRPGPCRDFAPYAPLGIGDDACDRARRRHGLKPL